MYRDRQAGSLLPHGPGHLYHRVLSLVFLSLINRFNLPGEIVLSKPLPLEQESIHFYFALLYRLFIYFYSLFHLPITVIPSAVLVPPPSYSSHSSGVPYCPSCGTLPPPLTYLLGSTLLPLSRLLTTLLQHQVFPSRPESLSTYKTTFFATHPICSVSTSSSASLKSFTRHSILWLRPFWTGNFRWKATRISSTPNLPSNRPPWGAVRLRPSPLCRLALGRVNNTTNLIHLRLLRRFALSHSSNDIKNFNAHKGGSCYRHQFAALNLVHI